MKRKNRDLKNKAFTRRIKPTLLLITTFLVATSALTANSWAWSNSGYSSDPANPNYGTHDWIAQHALDWLPTQEKQYILDNLATYLYGTELPDQKPASGGFGDTPKHVMYYNSDEALTNDAAASRAAVEYNNALDSLRNKDYPKAAKTAGIMSHYIADVAVFGHVMGTATEWGDEVHHDDYEREANKRTLSFQDAEFNFYLSFDGTLSITSAYDVAKDLAHDTTFHPDGTLTCTWMDQNYNWNNPAFKDRVGESLNLAVNYVTDVLHTLYQESLGTTLPIAEALVSITAVTAGGIGTAYVVRKRKKRKKHLNTILNNTTLVGKMERKEKRPKFWEQQKSVKTRSVERTYRCPTCNELLFSVPLSWPVPTEKTEVTCPHGHKVMVPKFTQTR